MKKYINFFPLFVFILIILGFFYLTIMKKDPYKLSSVLIEKKIPDFETNSLFEDKIFINDLVFNNEVVLVNFFASWCIPCIAEHKYLKLLSEEKIVKLIGINYKDNKINALEWIENYGNPYSNIGVDFDGRIAIEWGVYGIPESFIISKKNIIKYKIVGPITEENYDDLLKNIKKISAENEN